ncbi:MAG TPA: hypothetical protein VHU14_06630 [Solirubrobacterales bacterium]|nr:hypothetical protein [Solirubrobacterales bacterium]
MSKPLPAPHQLEELWLPIGPTTVLGGQAADGPNVTGRILDIDVSPNGRRVYAATAGGGVWYSNDEGASWMALGAWFVSPHQEQIDYFANSLTSGGVAVEWDSNPNGEADTVYVGTGEASPARQGYPGSYLAGIGVLAAHDPVGATRADPFAPVWSREADAMEGQGTYRLALRPGGGHAGELVAAVSDGFYARSGPAGSGTWTKASAEPFDHPRVVTDVVWAPSGIYVAVFEKGVWHAEKPAGPFSKIDLSGLQDGRISLAASTDGAVVYALGQSPRLWRIAGTAAKPVANVPRALLEEGKTGTEGGEEEDEARRVTGEPEGAQPPEAAGNQGSYDITVAVDPDHPDVIVLGGSSVETSHAALFRCTVQDPGGSPHLDYAPAHDTGGGGPANDPTYIGRGVHPDVHVLTFAKRSGNLDLWVGGDGGVYRSTHGGRSYTWQGRNNGLAAIEAGYVACHPGSEAVVVVGTQDNGVLERDGDTSWTWSLDGDGGGVGFHPLPNAGRYVAQATGSKWRSNDYRTKPPVLRSGAEPPPDHERKENEKAGFYSAPGVVAAGTRDGARLAIGTNRVWLSEDFGATWLTLPTGSDPRGAGSGGKPRHDTGQDVSYDDERARTLAARWNGEDELFVLNEHSVQRYDRAPGTGAWGRHAVTDHRNKCFAYKESDIKGAKMPYLPPLGSWSDLAVHLPGPDGKSTLYVSCASVHATPKMDTLWWYDGAGTWHATKLRDAVKAPALAVAVHPTDGNTVFVGTTLGVWKGTYSHPAGSDPVWIWSTFSAGLPEAAVQELAFFRDPPGGAPTMLLLRAALQSRGVWEVDLLAPCDEKTYLRVHGRDSRRRPVTSLADPMNPPGVDLDALASPDVAIRPAPPNSAATVPAVPEAAALPIGAGQRPGQPYEQWSFQLWTFQTAFRQIEPACRPTGHWLETFERLLVAYKQANGLGATPTIDQATWTNVVTQARVYQPPWDGPVPTEADLRQLLRGERVPNMPNAFTVRRLLVDVLVHHRGLQPLPSANASALLLRREMTEPEAEWESLAIGEQWKDATVAALTSGHAPAGGWPDNWAAADPTPVRHPAEALAAMDAAAASLDAARPRPAEFELTFPATTPDGSHLLLAVCSSTTATVTAARLAGSTLGELLTHNPHVAAHRLMLI